MKEYGMAAWFADALLAASPVPPAVDRLKFMAQVYADGGKLAKSVDMWVSVYWTSPDEADKPVALSAVTALEPTRRAIDLYRDYLLRHPDDQEGRVRLAKLYQARGEVEAFARELETLPAGDPVREDGRSQLLALYIARRDFDHLKPALEKLVREGKGGPELDRLYLDMLEETGQVAELGEQLERRLRESPEDAELLQRMAALKESRLLLGEAADVWARLYELGHAERGLAVKAAAVYELEGRWESARKLYRLLETRLPSEEEWSNKLSSLHDADHERQVAYRARDENDERQALAAARHRLSHDPSDVAMLRLAGELDFSLGNISEAKDYYRRLVQSDGSDPHDTYMLSECLAALGEKPGAQAMARKSLERMERLTDTAGQEFQNTRLVLRLGYTREAEQRLQALFLEDPDNTEVLSTYASLLLEHKDLAELDRVLAHWRTVDPKSDDLHLISGLALKRKGHLEEAAVELKPEPGSAPSAARAAEYAETLLELERWSEARSMLQEQDSQDPRLSILRERIETTYGPEGSGSLYNYEASQAQIWRARETYKAFLSQNLWIAQLLGYGAYQGKIAALGDTERNDLFEGTVDLGYWVSPELHLMAAAGAWQEAPGTQATGTLAADLKEKSWILSIDLEVNRPWDSLIESVAFGGREHRVEGQGEWTYDIFHFTGMARYSRYYVLDERGVLSSHYFGADPAFQARLEGRLWTRDTPSVGAEFWDETLRFDRGKTSSLSLVYQFYFEEFLGDPQELQVIPLVRRSTEHLAGVSGSWAQSENLWVNGEFLVGLDPARNLNLGALYTGSFKFIYVFTHRVLVDASVTYVSEQLKAGGGGSWVTQLSLNINF
jgi:hypothetical protein